MSDREELVESLVDTILTLSEKEGLPTWPVVPVSNNLGIVWEAKIPNNEDASILKTPVVVLGDMDSGLFVERVYLAEKHLCRKYRKTAEPGSPLVRIQWFDLHKNPVVMSGDFVVGRQRGGISILGPARTSHSFDGRGNWSVNGGLCFHEMKVVPLVAPGLRVALAASWVARIQLEKDKPSVELPTDPEGAYALFKDRSAEGGRKKRLLHWVKEHCRVVKEKQTKVAQHLRGIDRFEWQGSEVRLTPPSDSLEQAASKKRVAPSVIKAVERYRKLQEEYAGEW